MTVHERSVGAVSILDVHGRITVQEGVAAFRDAVQRLVAQKRFALLLNMQDVPYIDSTALGELARTYVTARRNGGVLKLIRPTPRVRDLLTVTRLISVFEIYDSEDLALKSFAPAK